MSYGKCVRLTSSVVAYWDKRWLNWHGLEEGFSYLFMWPVFNSSWKVREWVCDVGSQYLKKPFPGPWFVAVNLHYLVPVSWIWSEQSGRKEGEQRVDQSGHPCVLKKCVCWNRGWNLLSARKWSVFPQKRCTLGCRESFQTARIIEK